MYSVAGTIGAGGGCKRYVPVAELALSDADAHRSRHFVSPNLLMRIEHSSLLQRMQSVQWSIGLSYHTLGLE